jgi:hypothetical protein
MAGALVVLVIAAIAAVLLLPGGGEPAPAVFGVSGRPTDVAVAGDRVWVASPRSGALTVLDASGRPRFEVHVASAAHDACIVL